MKNKSSWFALGFFLSFFFLVSLVANWQLRRMDVPNYATWSGGLRDLEFKLQQIEWISKRGQVDALFLGSSVQDGGMSADAFTEELIKLRVKDSNAYNFALPAVGPVFWPIIYRLVRLSTKPKYIFVSSGVTGLGSRDPKRLKILAGPKLSAKGQGGFLLNAIDYFSSSPAALVVRHPMLLRLSKKLWKMPILEKAAAFKDFVIYGRYFHIQGSATDAVPRSGHGDGISYSFNPNLKVIQEWKSNYKEGLKSTVECIQTAPNDEERRLCFFGDDDLRAINEFLRLAKSDGVEVVHAPMESTVGNLPIVRADEEVIKNRRIWHTEFARLFGLRVIYFLDDFVIQPFELADGVHLNNLAGVRYGKMLARNWARAQGMELPRTEEDRSSFNIPFYYSFEHPDEELTDEQQTIGTGFIILKDDKAIGSTLEIKFYQRYNFEIGKTYTFEFCTPDRKTHYVQTVATELGFTRFKMPVGRHEKMALIGRLVEKDEKTGKYFVPARFSVESFKWIDS